MQFFLFRHADKERTFSSNPPLSKQGLMQAKTLLQLLQQEHIPSPSQIWASPKLRAVQTMEPLALHLGIKIQESKELLERQSDESTLKFVTRVKKSIARYEKQNGVIFAVTHYDWIEEFLSVSNSDTDFADSQYHSWPPCQFMEFEVKDGLWHFCRIGSV